ncbi:unnamed protein product [Trifolium pratense]|uniref:Uncharacterized protein n=1 Tax=Trifolium pratense TaxID=57577 RepID=A0ACB0LAB7_TRIPR|nr:unnamed protein product [Trifolium pratense]
MAKTLKFVFAIILFVFLFFIIEEVASSELMVFATSVKCTTPKDCPDVVIGPNQRYSMCINGYCQDIKEVPHYGG